MDVAGDELRVTAACPKCGAEWPVPARSAGTTVTCRECNTQVLAPFPTASVPVDHVIMLAPPSPAAAGDDAAADRTARRVEQANRRQWQVLAVGLAGLVLMLAACGGLALVRLTRP